MISKSRIRRSLLASAVSALSVLALASPAAAITLAQGTDTLSGVISPSCTSVGGMGAFNRENSFYRVFDLNGAHGINTAFTVSSITFGIKTANSGDGDGQPVTVRVSALQGPFALANMTLLGSQVITVEDDEDNTLRTAAVSGTVADPATSDLVAEVFIPDGEAGVDLFAMGVNEDPETAPSYIRAPSCAQIGAEPVTLASVGSPARWVLRVAGDAAPPAQPTPPPQATPPKQSAKKKKCKKKKKKRKSVSASAKKKRCKKKKK